VLDWWNKRWIQETVDALLDRLVDEVAVDLNTELCARLPMATVTRAMGLEGEDVIEFRYQLDRATFGAAQLPPEESAASRAWVCRQFDAGLIDTAGRCGLLVGRPSQGAADPGPIVCSCFAVGRNQILAAFAGGAANVDGIGAATAAGTNCGSCRAEIQGLIDHVTVQAAE